MFHIIYMSSEINSFSQSELMALLERSRQNNSAWGITGLLLYKDGSFLQVIEGEEPIVKSLFHKIGRDARHKDVVIFLQENIPAREFENWSMAFRNLDLGEEMLPEGYNDLLDSKWSPEMLAAYPGKVRAFLKIFATF